MVRAQEVTGPAGIAGDAVPRIRRIRQDGACLQSQDALLLVPGFLLLAAPVSLVRYRANVSGQYVKVDSCTAWTLTDEVEICGQS